MAPNDAGGRGTTASGPRSMTGFASVTGTEGDWRYSMDLRSVNGRGLDLRLRAPDWIEGFEPEARKALQAAVARGSVTLSVRVTREEASEGSRVNPVALSAALSALADIEEAAHGQGMTLISVSAADIAGMRGVIDTGDDADVNTAPLKSALMASLSDLIAAFNADRDREGRALAEVLTGRIDEIARLTEAANEALGDRTEAQRAALERNLARLLDASDLPDAGRLEQELAVIVVKSDVTEEIDRLGAHVAAARDLLTTAGPTGRKLDFLMQEFNREANTLCSKAGSAVLTSIGLDLKTVIDQMREQVQNVE